MSGIAPFCSAAVQHTTAGVRCASACSSRWRQQVPAAPRQRQPSTQALLRQGGLGPHLGDRASSWRTGRAAVHKGARDDCWVGAECTARGPANHASAPPPNAGACGDAAGLWGLAGPPAAVSSSGAAARPQFRLASRRAAGLAARPARVAAAYEHHSCERAGWLELEEGPE